jgi:hypothetical protein
MKLRVKGNSMRFRVSRSELNQLISGGIIEETVRFAPQPEAFLTYALESSADVSAISVRYHLQRVGVVLESNQLQTWSEPDQIGIYTSVAIGANDQLELIIEKDFACLTGSDDDNADTFSNPHANAAC